MHGSLRPAGSGRRVAGLRSAQSVSASRYAVIPARVSNLRKPRIALPTSRERLRTKTVSQLLSMKFLSRAKDVPSNFYSLHTISFGLLPSYANSQKSAFFHKHLIGNNLRILICDQKPEMICDKPRISLAHHLPRSIFGSEESARCSGGRAYANCYANSGCVSVCIIISSETDV